MTTTTTNGDGKTEAMPYHEEDKLGPLGTKVSALLHPNDLRKTLLRAFHDAVQDARDAAAFDDESSAKAVHDSRKALRRARAVLGMVAGALPKSERKAVGRALQESRRALSPIRDHAVAPETLGQLPLGDDDRAAAKRVVDNAAETLPAVVEIKQLLGESAARAAAQAEALEASLRAELSWQSVVDGIQEVYGDARHARRKAKDSKQWFHTWRRRCKELTFQLELLATHAGPRLAAIQSEVKGVTETLGEAVDLVMVREFVDTYGQGLGKGESDHLKSAIDARLEDLMAETRKAAKDTFSQKPSRFAKRLTKAVRRDLTPADDADVSENAGD
ncbi:MAG: CHAD domain-containing protein [Deltaproteobacteria bacterium]|nr:CHAD domain-containing protein [Deltaproteobacteria bacterium]